MMERQKAKTIIAKWHRASLEIRLSNEKKDKSDIGNNMDPNKANDKYLLKP